MDKEDFSMINFAMVWSFFFTNIICLLIETNYKLVLLCEVILVPILYILYYAIGKLVEKGII